MKPEDAETIGLIATIDPEALCRSAARLRAAIGPECLDTLILGLPVDGTTEEVRAFLRKEVEGPHMIALALAVAVGFEFMLSSPLLVAPVAPEG